MLLSIARHEVPKQSLMGLLRAYALAMRPVTWFLKRSHLDDNFITALVLCLIN